MKKQERKKMENKDIKDQEISELADVTELVEEIESATKESEVVELEEKIEEKVEKVKKSLSKNDEAKALMKSVENLVSKADKDVKELEDIVAEDVEEFKSRKELLAESTLVETKELLEKANYEYSEDEETEPFELSLGSTKEKIDIKNISSGYFTGFILAIVGMLATVATWVFFAAKKTGTVLTPDKLPEQNALDAMFTWIGGGMTGSTGNALFGMITVALTTLFVGFLIYKMRVVMKESKNFKVANKAFEKSHTYVEEQKESMSEMEKIDAHIIETTPLIDSYTIILNEQNAKLKRILHVEGTSEYDSEYHPNSQHTMDEAVNLMKRAERFINTSVSKDGRFNEESVVAYREAKALYESYIAQTYA